MLFGEYTKATVKKVITSEDVVDKTFGGETSVSLIEYFVDGRKYVVEGPIDLKFPEGKKLPVVYRKKNPNEYLILNLRSIYLGKTVILPFVLIVLWISLYTAIRQSNKPRYL